MNATWHVSYTAGPVSFGYQTGGADNALVTGTELLQELQELLVLKLLTLLSCTQQLVVYLSMRKCQSLQT